MPVYRSVAINIFKALSGEGLSINKMIGMVRDLGYGYHAQTMQDDARRALDLLKYEKSITRLGFDEYIPREQMIETELAQDAKYRVHGYMTVYDEETDTYLTQKASFYTDDYSRTGDYGQSFFDFYTGRYEQQDLEIVEFKTRAVEHNTLMGY